MNGKKRLQIRKNVSLDTWIIMPNHLHGIVIINSDGLPVETHCSASQNETAHNAPHSKMHSSAGFKETHSRAGFKETHNSAGFKQTHNSAGFKETHNDCGKDVGVQETHSSASLPYKNKFGPQANNLSSIIRGFKSASTTRIRITGFSFSWQPRFYDHIIRNEKKS